MTFNDLIQEFHTRVSFGYPERVTLTCAACGLPHPAARQYRYGQHRYWFVVENDALISTDQCPMRAQ